MLLSYRSQSDFRGVETVRAQAESGEREKRGRAWNFTVKFIVHGREDRGTWALVRPQPRVWNYTKICTCELMQFLINTDRKIAAFVYNLSSDGNELFSKLPSFSFVHWAAIKKKCENSWNLNVWLALLNKTVTGTINQVLTSGHDNNLFSSFANLLPIILYKLYNTRNFLTRYQGIRTP